MTLLEDYLLWTLTLAKPRNDVTLMPRIAEILKSQGHQFTIEVIDLESLNFCLYNTITAIAEHGCCPESTLPIVKEFIEHILTNANLQPDYCYIAAKALIARYNLNILQVFKPYFCKAIEDELKYILSSNSRTTPVYLAKLIILGVDMSFFEAYEKKSLVYNLIVKRAIFGLYSGSAEQKICIDAAMIISQLNGFQVSVPQDLQETHNKLRLLLRLGIPLHCFNKFPINILKDHLHCGWHLNNNDLSFEIALLNAGRSPSDLGIECSSDNHKLFEIAKLYNYDALLAMFNLVNIHGYNFPQNIMLMFLTNIQVMYDSSELPQQELYLLAYILHTGLKSDDYELVVDTELAAELYERSIATYQDSRAMVNLGFMHQYGLFKSAMPDYVVAAKYFTMAVNTNNDPIAKSNLATLKANHLCL